MWIPSLSRFLTRSPRKTRRPSPKAKPRPRTVLSLERLEDRTVPTTLTVLGSHLHTFGGQQQAYSVDGVPPPFVRGDITVDVAPGTYQVVSGTTRPYGTFTVSGAGTVAADGALTAAGSAIDFDLTKLAAVTVKASDFLTAGGRPEFVYVENEVTFRHGGVDDTAYLPAGTFFLDTGTGNDRLGSFTVALDGSGTLTVTGATGAVAATDNTISVDLTKLAAVTVNANGYHTATGLPESLYVENVAGLPYFGDRVDTVYLPAGTFALDTSANNAELGIFTVAPDGSGTLSVTGATGALAATGNLLDIDLTKLAPVLVRANDFHTAEGQPETVAVSDVVFLPFTGDRDDTVYLPAGRFALATGDHATFGIVIVSANGTGALAVSGTEGAIRATGNEVTWSPCDLSNVRITPNPGVQWRVDFGGAAVLTSNVNDTDTVLLPTISASYTLWITPPGSPGFTEPFSVGPSGLSATQLPQDAPLVTLELVPCHLQVLIDVKVGNAIDPINVANQGVIPVVLFGDAGFDVTQVDLGTVRFAGAAVFQWALADVNGDGRLDLVLKFRTQDTNLRALYEQLIADDINADGVLDSNRQEAQVSLTGQTTAEQLFEGSDDVTLFLAGRALRDLLTSLAAAGLI